MSIHPDANLACDQSDFLDKLYETYKTHPEDLEPSWRQFFAGFEFGASKGHRPNAYKVLHTDSSSSTRDADDLLLQAFRSKGHRSACINPLTAKPKLLDPSLQLETYGLTPLGLMSHTKTWGTRLDELQKIYCHTIGVEWSHLEDGPHKTWLYERLEHAQGQWNYSKTDKHFILTQLAYADGFERFLQARYLGQKRFSLEGLDSVLALLQLGCERGVDFGVKEVCLGMAHRGRLNILSHFLKKPYEMLLSEFEGNDSPKGVIEGDVKYHMGYVQEVSLRNGAKVRLYLSPNPSHLEAVNPVLTGYAFCRQNLGDKKRKTVLPILLHGDAAFMGQGIVAETLNMCRLDSYHVGGCLHVITNNQIGFTTNPSDSRSTEYASDISKMIQAPVVHVNADDPEAVVWVGQLAVEYRQTFGSDFIVDVIGYRRHGHNETDEPNFTQPHMYAQIAKHPSVYDLYKQALIAESMLTAEEAKILEVKIWAELQASYEGNKKHGPTKQSSAYTTPSDAAIFSKVKTSISKHMWDDLGRVLTHIPDHFEPHVKIKKLLAQRSEMLAPSGSVDWPMAELLALGSLAKEGVSIRLSGQDCKRGTFSSRQGVWFDHRSGVEYGPLHEYGVEMINSPLSEQACLGFELGISWALREAERKHLVLWEAQFGDFVNGAQIIIDQFLVACEAKWQKTSGLVLLLPHGYEGMGPEHSNARPERFLQACGAFNIQVCNVTTPAQYFHLLRRQALRPIVKPLMIMSPKSLLRHPKVVSPVDAFLQEGFREILEDIAALKQAQKVHTLLFCTGKIFFELQDYKATLPLEVQASTACIRIEQLYPFAMDMCIQIIYSFPQRPQCVWVQEEPQNMGAWNYIAPLLKHASGRQDEVLYIGRKAAGTTAEGYAKAHQKEQQRIIKQAFDFKGKKKVK